MTDIRDALIYQLQSLADVLGQLDNNAYCHRSSWLSEATIGQHSRHIIELVQCLLQGYEDGLVNYDNRKRDEQIEGNCSKAIAAIHALLPRIVKEDKAITIEGNFDTAAEALLQIKSTYHREVAYNVEHAVHHMALIKVGLKELNVELANENFGVAYATVQYRKLCAQ